MSLLVVSILSACAAPTAKSLIERPASLNLVEMPSDEELSCLAVDVFSNVITREDALFNRVQTLEAQIDAHNKND